MEETELLRTILLRENVELSIKFYLLQQLRPTPRLKTKELSIFEAWQNYMLRKAAVKLEKASPEVILRTQMKIAALRVEIR